VDFTESGLSPSTQWAVDFNKVTQEGSGPAIIFAGIPNGTYPFTVVPIRNYNISPVSGSVTVAGSNRAQNVTFKEIHVPLGAMINWTTVSGTGFCGGGPFSATVQFYGNGSGGSPPYSFYWTFGDNVSRSTLQDPRYTYTTGPTTATLSVTDSVGNETNKSVSLVWTSSCPPATGTIGDALPVITIVVSLMIAISVGAFAHRVSRVKPGSSKTSAKRRAFRPPSTALDPNRSSRRQMDIVRLRRSILGSSRRNPPIGVPAQFLGRPRHRRCSFRRWTRMNRHR
jgi:hypothetical protein